MIVVKLFSIAKYICSGNETEEGQTCLKICSKISGCSEIGQCSKIQKCNGNDSGKEKKVVVENVFAVKLLRVAKCKNVLKKL